MTGPGMPAVLVELMAEHQVAGDAASTGLGSPFARLYGSTPRCWAYEPGSGLTCVLPAGHDLPFGVENNPATLLPRRMLPLHLDGSFFRAPAPAAWCPWEAPPPVVVGCLRSWWERPR